MSNIDIFNMGAGLRIGKAGAHKDVTYPFVQCVLTAHANNFIAKSGIRTRYLVQKPVGTAKLTITGLIDYDLPHRHPDTISGDMNINPVNAITRQLR
jgi:hypothetical protein